MRSIVLIHLILASVVIYAQENNASIEPVEYVYKTIDSKSLKAYVFFPIDKQKVEKSPAIAIFHGGGWAMGEPSWGFGRAQQYAQMGFVAIAVQYQYQIKNRLPQLTQWKIRKTFSCGQEKTAPDLKFTRIV